MTILKRLFFWTMVLALVVVPLVPARRTQAQSARASMVRDQFGRPTVTAEDEYSLFEMYGYAVAEDRLWQLELFRRSAKGTLSEMLGPNGLNSDLVERREGYTEAEYQAIFDALPDFVKSWIQGYRDGINRYLAEAVADPVNKLPWEFHATNFQPAPWRVTDTIAIGRLMVRRFGESGSRELRNLTVFQTLVNRYGPAVARNIFNDLRWQNDPDSPVTVPHGDPGSIPLVLMPEPGAAVAEATPGSFDYTSFPNIGHLAAAYEEELAARDRVLQSVGFPLKFGSYAYVVSAEKSVSGKPVLLGGPQMGFSYPDIIHEVHLQAPGINVTGMSFAGVPPVLIGHSDRFAWTSTTGMGDNTDTYIETLNPQNPNQYLYNGQWRDMEVREEVFNVRGGPPETRVFARTTHGPVVQVDTQNNVAIVIKRAHWMREMETALAFFNWNRSTTNMEEFQEALKSIITTHNFLYADVDGNIAYWQSGRVPIRPLGFDPRLPLPGTGIAEWLPGVRPIPRSINPAQGYLANWNNKASIDFDNMASGNFGKQFRVLRLQELLANPTLIYARSEGGDPGKLRPEDFRAIERDAARLDGNGLRKQFVIDYISKAVSEVGGGEGRLTQAKQMLEQWSGYLFEDAITSTTVEPAEAIFGAWLDRMIRNTFEDDVGSSLVGEANLNTVTHVLDGPASGVPPSRDYFNGEDWRQVVVRSLNEALTALQGRFNTPDMTAWRAPRPTIAFRHTLLFEVGPAIPNSNRSTYTQIVHLTDPIQGINIIPSGQSAFFKLNPNNPTVPAATPDLINQRIMFRNFEFLLTQMSGR
ncbi:MAG: penicillin acylase family protein [Acidobacteria bacterium]|nr:penicillin acylase family protein [Acidobacteriota bacterium]